MGRHNKLDLYHWRQPRSRSRMHDDAQRGDKRDSLSVQNLCCISTIFTHTEFGCARVCVCVCMVECVCMCVHKRKHISEREKKREGE